MDSFSAKHLAARLIPKVCGTGLGVRLNSYGQKDGVDHRKQAGNRLQRSIGRLEGKLGVLDACWKLGDACTNRDCVKCHSHFLEQFRKK